MAFHKFRGVRRRSAGVNEYSDLDHIIEPTLAGLSDSRELWIPGIKTLADLVRHLRDGCD